MIDAAHTVGTLCTNRCPSRGRMSPSEFGRPAHYRPLRSIEVRMVRSFFEVSACAAVAVGALALSHVDRLIRVLSPSTATVAAIKLGQPGQLACECRGAFVEDCNTAVPCLRNWTGCIRDPHSIANDKICETLTTFCPTAACGTNKFNEKCTNDNCTPVP